MEGDNSGNGDVGLGGGSWECLEKVFLNVFAFECCDSKEW